MRKHRAVRVGFTLVSFLMVALSMGQAPKPDTSKNTKEFPYVDFYKPGAAEEAIKPLPLEPIPDNPPPYEGALVHFPYRIQPPDLVIIEVLEALPVRPISGEHLVRPDGKVSLGFYGEVAITGLTLTQAKAKIIHHLRSFLTDRSLGLMMYHELPPENLSLPLPPPGTIAEGMLLPNEEAIEEPIDPKKQESGISGPSEPELRRAADEYDTTYDKLLDLLIALRSKDKRPLKGDEPTLPPPSEKSPFPEESPIKEPVKSPFPEPKAVTPKIAKPTNPKAHQKPAEKADVKPEGDAKIMPVVPRSTEEWEGHYLHVPPESSHTVFVDISSYNSGVYYVLGDVGSPGRLPSTGNETVLDALQYAGGLTHSGDIKKIVLHRPARGGNPIHAYKIDLDAIQRGVKTANLQLFPGDRLIVGRSAEYLKAEPKPKK